jgi:hypothetical protein
MEDCGESEALMNLKILTMVSLLLAAAQAQAKTENCEYELNKDTVVVEWTAFKTTEKIAVKGTFKSVNVQGETKADSLLRLFKGLNVSVDRASVETGNPARNDTLVKSFFSKLAAGEIRGKIVEYIAEKNSLFMMLAFNGQNKRVTMKVDHQGDDYTATGSLDIMDYSAGPALHLLNQACLELHKGKDGVSKTWSDVDLSLKGHITKTCK